MRTIQIDESEQDHTWIWLAAGAALGLVAGVLIARRGRGGKLSLRGLAERAMDNIEPVLEIVRKFRSGGEDDGAEDSDDADEDEGSDEAATELDAEAGDAASDDVEYDDDDGDDEDDVPALDARVREAFANDPVLAERAVEIEEDREGSIVLHGRVRSAREVKHAVTIARGVPGVEAVRHRLTVRTRPR